MGAAAAAPTPAEVERQGGADAYTGRYRVAVGRDKKRWSELSPAVRTAIVLGGIAELVVTGVALRDLVHRPARLVRGRKGLWCALLFVQPVGSPAYLLVGRRAATA